MEIHPPEYTLLADKTGSLRDRDYLAAGSDVTLPFNIQPQIAGIFSRGIYWEGDT